MRRTCEVPVLPPMAYCFSVMRERQAVPPCGLLTTSIMPCITVRRDASLSPSDLKLRGGSSAGSTPGGASVRRGVTAKPPLTSRDVITASCSGVAST